MHCSNCHHCNAFVVHKKKDASGDYRYICKDHTSYNSITCSDGCKHIFSLAQMAEMQANFASIYPDCFGFKSKPTTVAYVSEYFFGDIKKLQLQSHQSVKPVYVSREVQTEHFFTCSVETQTNAPRKELSKTESSAPPDLGLVPMSPALLASPSPSLPSAPGMTYTSALQQPSVLALLANQLSSKEALTSLLAKPKTRPASAVKPLIKKNFQILGFDVRSCALLNVSFLGESTCELLLASHAFTSYQEKLVSLAPSSLQVHSGFNPAKPANADALVALCVHLTNKFVMRASKIIHKNGTISIVCKYFLSLLHENNLSCLSLFQTNSLAYIAHFALNSIYFIHASH
ncbi:hypothetical protein DSO57_1002019 [Entomophthora muscae]|uniref:Uncharacterized protein n=1 Tax=Entomophthora muscae TaxID=34485 RepID=A0ACC2RNZ4_9FUNG|nr:hypothetical protein DSO57_1002019 [Entomophthora muscae]